jgi:PKD repeat protein
LSLCFISFFASICWGQGVTIGSNSPAHPSAVLDVQSTNQGFLLPRISSGARDSILNPQPGLQIYNITTQCMEVYHAVGWRPYSCSCTQAPAVPVSIIGPTQVCDGQQGVVYSVAAVPGAVTYQWSLPAGASLVSGQGDTTIVVNFATTGGAFSVEASNFCGTSLPQTASIIVDKPTASFSVTPASPTVNTPSQFQAQQAGLTYSWSFLGGNPSTSTVQSPAVTYSSAGTYTANLLVTDVAGCVDSSTQQVVVTNCPPPGQTQVTFNYTGAVQSWVVPSCASTARIQVFGAQGGNAGSSPGGRGARMEGDFVLTPGETLTIVVGGRGNDEGVTSGGGGGSGVVRQSTPLIIAGAGAGVNGSQTHAGMHGDTGQNGQQGAGSSGAAGTNGNDGQGYTYSGSHIAHGGRGFNSGNSGSWGLNGQSSNTQTTNGTFGLGGGGGSVGSGWCNCGGGGGGYSGGSSGGTNSSGGGGGSFNSGTNQNNAAGVRNGDGQVVISY